MMKNGFWIASALLLASACGNRSDEKAEPKLRAAPQQAGDACSVRVAALVERITPYQSGIRTLSQPPARVEMPTATAARPLDARGPVIASDRNRLEIAGERLGSVAALGERLTRDKRAAEIAAEGNQSAMPLVYFQVDRSLPVAALVKLVAQTPDGVAARLLVTRPGPTEPYDAPASAPEAVRALLRGLQEKSEPAERAVFLAEAVERATGTCAPLVELFAAVASMPVDDKQRAMVSGFGPALRKCKCSGVDLDVFEVFLLAVSDAFREPQGWLPLDFDPASKRSLSLPAEATAHDLAAALEKLPAAALDEPVALKLGK